MLLAVRLSIKTAKGCTYAYYPLLNFQRYIIKIPLFYYFIVRVCQVWCTVKKSNSHYGYSLHLF